MRAFEWPTLRISVEEAEYQGSPVIAVRLESPGGSVGMLTPPPAPSEAAVALDAVQTIKRVHSMGVAPYVKSQLKADPSLDEGDERRRAAALFAVAQGASDQDLDRAERELQVEAVPEGEREAMEVLQKTLTRAFEVGDVRIRVSPSTPGPGGQIWFHIVIEGPGGLREEDLMLRPPSYPTSQTAADHFKVIRYVLESGVQAGVARHLKANYLGEEWREEATAYMMKLDQIGRALGLAKVIQIEERLEEEEREKETEEREETLKSFVEKEERESLAALEEAERRIEARLKELREKRAGKK